MKRWICSPILQRTESFLFETQRRVRYFPKVFLLRADPKSRLSGLSNFMAISINVIRDFHSYILYKLEDSISYFGGDYSDKYSVSLTSFPDLVLKPQIVFSKKDCTQSEYQTDWWERTEICRDIKLHSSKFLWFTRKVTFSLFIITFHYPNSLLKV